LFGCILEKGRGKGLRSFEGVKYPYKLLIFNSLKLGEFGGEEGRVISLILKRFKL
jgi:hypothetical protein